MVDSYLSIKFGINLLDGFWENASHGRTTDNSPSQYAIISGCEQPEQPELKSIWQIEEKLPELQCHYP